MNRAGLSWRPAARLSAVGARALLVTAAGLRDQALPMAVISGLRRPIWKEPAPGSASYSGRLRRVDGLRRGFLRRKGLGGRRRLVRGREAVREAAALRTAGQSGTDLQREHRRFQDGRPGGMACGRDARTLAGWRSRAGTGLENQVRRAMRCGLDADLADPGRRSRRDHRSRNPAPTGRRRRQVRRQGYLFTPMVPARQLSALHACLMPASGDARECVAPQGRAQRLAASAERTARVRRAT